MVRHMHLHFQFTLRTLPAHMCENSEFNMLHSPRRTHIKQYIDAESMNH